MSPTEISSIVVAVATVVYTVGTFLLWFSTRRSLKLAAAQSRASTVSSLTTSHRDVYARLLGDPELQSILTPAAGADVSQVKADLAVAFLLNHILQAYYYRRLGLIDDELWAVLELDARELLSLPQVYSKWKSVRQAFPQSFSSFINSQLPAAALELSPPSSKASPGAAGMEGDDAKA